MKFNKDTHQYNQEMFAPSRGRELKFEATEESASYTVRPLAGAGIEIRS